MIKNKTGVWGELYAVRYLRDNKYEIITTNYICRFGEADIIAKEGDQICFVEVKTRDENSLSRPADAVDEQKQNRLELTARNFMTYTKEESNIRFDVCEVWIDKNYKLTKLNYIKNAF